MPISKLADIIDDTKKALGETGLVGAMVGHVGDGNFHCDALKLRYHETSLTEIQGSCSLQTMSGLLLRRLSTIW